jgi:hypothetical protein
LTASVKLLKLFPEEGKVLLMVNTPVVNAGPDGKSLMIETLSMAAGGFTPMLLLFFQVKMSRMVEAAEQLLMSCGGITIFSTLPNESFNITAMVLAGEGKKPFVSAVAGVNVVGATLTIRASLKVVNPSSP